MGLAAALIAVSALLGQAIFPHVHAAPLANKAPTVRELAIPACGERRPAALAATTLPSSDGDAHRHAPSSCPLCRAQIDARSSVPSTALALPAPTLGVTPSVPDSETALAVAVRDFAAPRGPPSAS
ncbi:MAG: hypothetical protein IT293_06325 [Deltaproteobacteria bacterium]|nr:hypothetical protein [Deltaproteobacteria bacterium]